MSEPTHFASGLYSVESDEMFFESIKPKSDYFTNYNALGKNIDFQCITASGMAALQQCEITTPGMVDLQVNGYAGIDFNGEKITSTDIDYALEAMLRDGTCFCLPTLITDSFEDLRQKIVSIDNAIQNSKLGPLMVIGLHLEGPFISPVNGYRGCHPLEGVQVPQIDSYNRLIEGISTPIAMVTLAPECDEEQQLSKYLVSQGITVSIGHSNASRKDIAEAVSNGVDCATHLNNGLTPTLDKNENPLFSLLSEDGINAGIIADGIHILPHIMRIIWRTKSKERLFLVTDGTAACSAPEGNYTLGKVAIRRDSDGSVKMIDQDRLAGSSVTMEAMINNMRNWFGLSINDLVLIGSANPRKMIGLSENPSKGEVTNLVKWKFVNGKLCVIETRFGSKIYKKDKYS